MRHSKRKIEVFLYGAHKNDVELSDTIPSCKRGFPLLYYNQKGKSKIPLSSIPGSNIGAIKHGECTAGPKYTGGQQPPCSSHIREYRETIKCCELEKMVPLARQCSEIIRKRGNQDVRYQEFNEMTLDCRRGEREKIAAVKGCFYFKFFCCAAAALTGRRFL